MEDGLIFDIERFSTADGPGIRTVVFFKGCNLRCPWCHNPESLRLYPEIEWDPQACIGCSLCAAVCPAGCHRFEEGGHLFLRERCTGCLRCAEQCPVSALKAIGVRTSVEACMEEIIADLPFYRRSGGGVTLSGGEVLLQSGFAARLLRRCREKGIHTAVESNLCAGREQLERLVPWLDLVMADIKHMDPDTHRRVCGADNRQTLENLRWLDEQGLPLIVRTPVIPGFNDTPENIQATGAFLAGLKGLRYYELLSYNPMGNDKRKRLGYPVPRLEVPERDHMRGLARTARQFVRRVWVDGNEI